MAVSSMLETKHVFAVSDVSKTDRNLLVRAVMQGKADRVRRGVYVSRSGQFASAAPDPVEIAMTVCPDAIFCYLTALQLHGVEHNISFTTQFYTAGTRKSFGYQERDYVPYRPPQEVLSNEVNFALGRTCAVTSREQTIIDTLATPARAGGVENVIRSISGFPYVDFDLLISLAATASQTLIARLGWLLEVMADRWEIPETKIDSLKNARNKNICYFDRSHIREYFDPQWRLYFPNDKEELEEWLS